MARIVGYWENTRDCYSEGPFVVCKLFGNHDYRLEMDQGGPCPALPPTSIYRYISSLRMETRGSLKTVSETADRLNTLVANGELSYASLA